MLLKNRSRAVDMGEMIAQLMGIAMPLLTDGVPVQVSQNAEDNSMDIYLGTEFLVPILKCASPLFEDEDFINMLLEEMAKDPTFGSMAPMMEEHCAPCRKSSTTQPRLNWEYIS